MRRVAAIGLLLAACGGPAFPSAASPSSDQVGGFAGRFIWAVEEGPTAAFGRVDLEALAAAVALPVGATGVGGPPYPVTVVGTFDPRADAEEAAATVAGQGRIAVLGPIVAVSMDVADQDGALPAEDLLSARGASVLVEGDRAGEGSIVVDLSCTTQDAAMASDLGTQLADYASLYHYLWARPPWIAPPLTDDEALARSTFRRWLNAQTQAIQTDGRFLELANDWADAIQSGDRARVEAARIALDQHVAAIAANAPEPSPPVDPETLALIVRRPTGTTPEQSYRWGAEIGARMGQLPLLDAGGANPRPAAEQYRFTATLTTRAEGRTLDVGYAIFPRFVSGFASIVAWLERNGCGELRFRLVDADLI